MNEKPTHLDLFSGIGGFSIAFESEGFQTVGFCEKEPWAQQCLIEKFGAITAHSNSQRHLHGRVEINTTKPELGPLGDVATIFKPSSLRPHLHDNIFTLNGNDYAGVSIITGGFPCQPFSVAGKQRGSSDDRHLWPEMCRVIKEARPAFVLGENVSGIIGMELDNCLSDLEAIGYACWPIVVPACAVDARHRRDRVWILASDTRRDQRAEQEREHKRAKISGGSSENELEPRNDVADSKHGGIQERRGIEVVGRKCQQPRGICGNEQTGLQEQTGKILAHSDGAFSEGVKCAVGVQSERTVNEQYSRWLPEPAICRVANGVPHRSHRLKGLGNAIVPQIPKIFAKEIRKFFP